MRIWGIDFAGSVIYRARAALEAENVTFSEDLFRVGGKRGLEALRFLWEKSVELGEPLEEVLRWLERKSKDAEIHVCFWGFEGDNIREEVEKLGVVIYDIVAVDGGIPSRTAAIQHKYADVKTTGVVFCEDITEALSGEGRKVIWANGERAIRVLLEASEGRKLPPIWGFWMPFPDDADLLAEMGCEVWVSLGEVWAGFTEGKMREAVGGKREWRVLNLHKWLDVGVDVKISPRFVQAWAELEEVACNPRILGKTRAISRHTYRILGR